MSDQLALLAPEPRPLTPRQTIVLEALRRAGQDGLDAQTAGAIVHFEQGRHGETTPCKWCEAAGKEILKALKRRELVAERRKPHRHFVAVQTSPGASDEDGGSGGHPGRHHPPDGLPVYGSLPKHF